MKESAAFCKRALPRLLGTSGKETLLAVRSSQNQEAALTEQEKLTCEVRGMLIKGEADPLLKATLAKATMVTWCDQ